jgi:uncharacterized membrane protein
MEQQLYAWLLLIHIVATLSMFAGEGMMYLLVYQARQAPSPETLYPILGLSKKVLPLIQLASPVLLLSGLAMCGLVWGFQLAWVNLSLIGFFLTIVVVTRVDRPWGERLYAAVNAGDFPQAQRLVGDSTIARIRLMRLGTLLGLVFLMTLKPVLLGSLLGFTLIQLLFVGLAYRTSKPQAQPDAFAQS